MPYSLRADLEEYLTTTARDGVQAMIAALFSLPTTSSADGPLAQLPPPTTQIPRAKPLPKPKPPTKWEKFASAKGIQKKRKDKKVWDEEKQEWVDRWGWKGANKQEEVQWLMEVPANAGKLLSLLHSYDHLHVTSQSHRLRPKQGGEKSEKGKNGEK